MHGNVLRFRCGHPKIKDNIRWETNEKGGEPYPRCRTCRLSQSRARHKPKPRKPRGSFRCGHPQTSENTKMQKDSSNGKYYPNCRICINARELERWHRTKRERNAKRRKRKAFHLIGTIEYGATYESDRQCEKCGYTLRYVRSSDQCVACQRENARERHQRKKQEEDHAASFMNLPRSAAKSVAVL